ncbi:beta-1,3-glucanase family protein [Mycobacterium ulcerans]
MSFAMVRPEWVTAAASDLAGIGSSVGAANAAAAGSTTAVLAAGADEVSAVIAGFFGTHAQEYQAISARVATYHQQFVQSLNGSAGAYAAAEAASASSLQTLMRDALNLINTPTNALLGRPLIGNGANGAPGTGQAGGPGGILWGNGGAGGTGGVVGAGGAAGLFGSPGHAGIGGQTGTNGAAGGGGFGFREDFINNTGLPDNQIYVTEIGQTTPGHWAWIDQNGVAHPIDHNAADARGHLTKDGVNYANMSFTLDQAGNLTTPSEFQGGRVFISMKQPLYIAISPDNMGWAGPDPANPADPNYSTVDDWYEMTFNNGAIPFGGNTTQVDQFGFPFSVTVTQDSSGFAGTSGRTLSRAQVFQQFATTVPTEFQSLVVHDATGDPVRILSPRTAQPGGLSTCLDPSINDFWTTYQTNQFNYDGPGYTVQGSVNASDQFVYSVTPTGGSSTTYTMVKPTTAEVFAANGPFVGTAQQGAFLAELDAAFNRGVAISPDQWSNVADYYPTGGRWNNWAEFFHSDSINNLAYGFPFDDVNSQSSVLILDNSRPPTELSFNLGADASQVRCQWGRGIGGLC